MCDDQRFASRRPDVLTYRSEILDEAITVAGPIEVDLDVSISTTDADFIVKIIDQFPQDFSYGNNKTDYPMKSYEMMVRGEVLRGKYRNSMEKPEPFKPGQNTKVKFTLPDIAHTFQKGHKLVIQIQSTWFPLVDRNPQQFTDIYHCKDDAFKKSDITIFHDGQLHQSKIVLPVLD
jgi:putative CocE/NonD family hydrolase